MKSQVRSLLRPQPISSALVTSSILARAVVLVFAVFTTNGCYKTSAHVAGPARGESHTRTGSLYLLGTVGELEADVRDYCGTRPAVEVQTFGTIFTGAVTVATLGIYSPRQVRIVCAAKEAR
jgi:hypothetical protein